MSNDALTQGTSLGAISDKDEIRVLVAYIFSVSKTAFSFNDINEILQKSQLVNYFEAAQAFKDLLKKEIICIVNEDEKEEKYILTNSGKFVVNQLSDNLAKTTREKVKGIALMLETKHKIEKENKVKIKEIESGYMVTCNISADENMDLFNFSIYVPDYDQAKALKKNFLESPSKIYNIMLASLTKNKDLVKDILEKI